MGRRKGKNYREQRLKKVAVKYEKQYGEYLKAFEKGNLTQYLMRKSSQLARDNWGHRIKLWRDASEEK